MMGKPMSLCISDDNKWLVCGFEAGSIVLWDLATSSVVKTVTGVAFESPSIVKVQFWKGNTDFLSLDSSGNVVLHTIEKYLWTGIRSRKLFQTTAAVYHDARTSTLENGHIVLALANVDYVYLIRLEPSM
jgi:WD40 repeat protein